jgi:hypothetical protein
MTGSEWSTAAAYLVESARRTSGASGEPVDVLLRYLFHDRHAGRPYRRFRAVGGGRLVSSTRVAISPGIYLAGAALAGSILMWFSLPETKSVDLAQG